MDKTSFARSFLLDRALFLDFIYVNLAKYNSMRCRTR